ncbi:Aspartate aminotransferase, mitochondrial [Blomia tropicalis]|nr:Aspartate aminotransferase, mitochondrial [Blomia tropicalis]
MTLKRFVHNATAAAAAAMNRPRPTSKPSTLNSFWGKVTLAPRDPIISINQLYKQDPNPKKINFSIGTYRTEENESFIFSSVQKAEEKVFSETRILEKEYSPMEGFHPFNKLAYELLFGNDHYEQSNITVQTLAGTGALDLGATFLGKFYLGRKEAFISQPSWINHYLIFTNYGFNTKAFRYYDNKRKQFDTNGFFEDIEKLPDHSVVLFQPCGHNPASVQPTPSQWDMISRIIREKNILPFFDIAYHGLCSGQIESDVYAIRKFAQDGHHMLVSQSFSKNMSLYGDRVGSLTIMCESEDEAYRVRSQLKNLIISKYICPPFQTGRVVATVLEDQFLRHEWIEQLGGITERLQRTRWQLRRKLESVCPEHQWKHITEQCGIFWYSGLTSSQVETLINEYSIYLCEDGRVNIAGINPNNIDLFGDVIRDVINR